MRIENEDERSFYEISYKPTGDQLQTITGLVKGFKEMFPENAVEYFVS